MVHADAQQAAGCRCHFSRGAYQKRLRHIIFADASDERAAPGAVEGQVPQQVAISPTDAVRPGVVLHSRAANRASRLEDQPLGRCEFDLRSSPDSGSLDGKVLGDPSRTRRRSLRGPEGHNQTADQEKYGSHRAGYLILVRFPVRSRPVSWHPNVLASASKGEPLMFGIFRPTSVSAVGKPLTALLVLLALVEPLTAQQPAPPLPTPGPTMADALKALDMARAAAVKANLNLSCAVVDSRGDLIALTRMDGARFFRADVALGKA